MWMGWNQPVLAVLPPGNAIKDPSAILRNALPIEQKDLRDLQNNLESTNNEIRGNRWTAIGEAVSNSEFLLSTRSQKILSEFPPSRIEEAELILKALNKNLKILSEKAKEENKDEFITEKRRSLDKIGDLESLLLNEEFPYKIPNEFDNLPRLLGRATVTIKTSQGDMNAVIDGYNAPLTSGAFIDLTEKGFYDGLPFTRAEDFYVLQSGDPEGPEIGYIDPNTGKNRQVPLEIRIPGQSETIYNQTFEDIGQYKATPVLPFSTLGTLGWAHSDQSLDDGSSQFFIFLYEAELTPAGLNLIDGRNAAFGYIVDGFDVLQKLSVEDKIISIKVIDGSNRLKAKA